MYNHFNSLSQPSKTDLCCGATLYFKNEKNDTSIACARMRAARKVKPLKNSAGVLYCHMEIKWNALSRAVIQLLFKKSRQRSWLCFDILRTLFR